MAKRRREPRHDGATPAAAEAAYNTVFVDTNLDTHLAMLISYGDTVSDFKEKIMLEHMRCFPKFGKLNVQVLKVKRRGNFYHLPDFMLVRNAFEGLKRNWFLSADVSSSEECYDNRISLCETGNLHSSKYHQDDGQSILPNDSPKILPGISEFKNQMVPTTNLSIPNQHSKRVSEGGINVRNGVDGNCRELYSDVNKTSADTTLPSDHNAKENIISEMAAAFTVDDKTDNIQLSNSAEQSTRTRSPPKKKQKRRHVADGSHVPTVELDRMGVHARMEDTASRSKNFGSGKSLVGDPESEDAQHRKQDLPEATATPSVVQIDQPPTEVCDASVKRLQLQSSAMEKYESGNDGSTENLLDAGNSREEYMLESVTPVPEKSTIDQRKIVEQNARSAHLEASASRTSLFKEKRKKKKINTRVYFTHPPLGESSPAVNHEETNQTDAGEKHKEFSLNCDPVVMQSKEVGPENQVEAGASIQPDKLSDASGKRKHESGTKRKSKKSSAEIHDETDVKNSDSVTSLSCSDAPNFGLSNTKTDSILIPSETDVPAEMEESYLIVNHDPVKVLWEADLTVKEPNISAKVLDANEATSNYSGVKRKKKKRGEKAAGKIKDASHNKHVIEKSENGENYAGTDQHRKNEQESGLSLDCNPEMMLPSNGDSLGCDKPDITPKETDVALKETVPTEMLDVETVVEPRSSMGARKKKSVKKSAHGSKGVNDAQFNERAEESKFKDGMKRKSMEDSAGYALQEAGNANGDGENLLQMALTGGTSQRTEVMDGQITKIEGKNQSLADSCVGDLPVEGQENQVHSSQLGQLYKNQENTGHVNKKEKKKMKKKQVSASKDHASSPTNSQDVAAKEFASNDELRMVGNLSEAAKLKTVPETEPSTDNLGRNSKNEDEGINFKRYFIPDQQQDKVASTDSVKSTRSNQKMKADKNRKKHGLPSVSSKLSIQNTVKSCGNEKNENQSFVRHGDSSSKHDRSEVMVGSKKSSEVSENKEKSSNLSEAVGTRTLQEQDVTSAAYALKASSNAAASLEENNKSFSGLSSKPFTEKGKDKRQRLEAPNGVAGIKTGVLVNSSQQKRSLLTKSGTMFWDKISESSADENGNINSDASTRTPSSSSSSSGDSDGGSELSQESTRNGPKGAKRRGDHGENIFKSALSGAKNITMDMLLRSSASFKKAKRIAAQNETEDSESQPVEFVPDSQVNS